LDTSKFTKADISKISGVVNDGLKALKDGWKPKSFGEADAAMLAKIPASIKAIEADLNNIATAADFGDYMSKGLAKKLDKDLNISPDF
jgi:hypothetical protein